MIINKLIQSKLMSTMEKLDFDPRVWGPKGWFFLETIVQSLPNDIDENLEKEIKNYLICTAKFLPCTFCSIHMKEYIADTKLENEDFSRKQYVLEWLNNLHNIRLPKDKQRTLKQVTQYYKHAYDVNNTNYTDLFFIFMATVIATLMLKFLLKK